jgi:hypothetical protein
MLGGLVMLGGLGILTLVPVTLAQLFTQVGGFLTGQQFLSTIGDLISSILLLILSVFTGIGGVMGG